MNISDEQKLKVLYLLFLRPVGARAYTTCQSEPPSPLSLGHSGHTVKTTLFLGSTDMKPAAEIRFDRRSRVDRWIGSICGVQLSCPDRGAGPDRGEDLGSASMVDMELREHLVTLSRYCYKSTSQQIYHTVKIFSDFLAPGVSLTHPAGMPTLGYFVY